MLLADKCLFVRGILFTSSLSLILSEIFLALKLSTWQFNSSIYCFVSTIKLRTLIVTSFSVTDFDASSNSLQASFRNDDKLESLLAMLTLILCIFERDY